jgi:uncharacterized protein
VETVTQSPDTLRPLLQLDPWAADYEGAIQIDPGDDNAPDQVDAGVETGEWKPCPAPDGTAIPTLYFVDGVRRTEARVLAWGSRQYHSRIVRNNSRGCCPQLGWQSEFGHCDVRRVLVLGGGHSRSETVQAGGGELIFMGFASTAVTPTEIAGELQELMRQFEADIAAAVMTEDAVVFIDGPLAYITSLGSAIGVVKRISVPYIDASHFALLPALAAGERTPIFLIADRKRDRYSWYLRIGQRRFFDHELTGIVRLEVRSSAGLDLATRLAGISSAVLPQFASLALRDPRAPQNLSRSVRSSRTYVGAWATRC